MNEQSKPISFGVVGLAAALESTPERIRALIRAGAIRAEFIEAREPRWYVMGLKDVIDRVRPAQPGDQLIALERAAFGLAALERAYRAEYGATLEQEERHG